MKGINKIATTPSYNFSIFDDLETATEIEGKCEKIGKKHYLLTFGCTKFIVHNSKEAGEALEKAFKEYFETKKK